jgi:ABC-type lipoprotein release transport system permease subunit
MRIIQMAWQEIRRRRTSFVLAVIGVAVAVGTMLGTTAALKLYDLRAEQQLARKQAELQERLRTLEDEMRKATLKLSFNLVILPAAQETHEWHAQDYATASMPEDYVHRLARSPLLSVRHFLPTLSQKVKWPEMKRTVFLVGCRGEVPNLAKNPRAPLVQPVPAGCMIVGYELQQSLQLEVGQQVRLMGREFTVHKCYPQRGSKEDIGVWIPLKDAQELLDRPGQINAIMALECVCVGSSAVERVRAEIARFLPDTKVLELGTKALARSEARAKVSQEAQRALQQEESTQRELRADRRQLAAVLVPGVVVGCAVWILLTTLVNVRRRKFEVAVLRAIGCRAGQILILFLSRALLVGVVGAALGGAAALGIVAVLRGNWDLPLIGATGMLTWPLLIASLVIGTLVGVVAGWIPALIAAGQDPAAVLKDV